MFNEKNKIKNSINIGSRTSLGPTSFPNLLEGTFDQRTVYVEYSTKSRVPHIIIYCKPEQFPELLESKEQWLDDNGYYRRHQNNINNVDFKRIVDFLLTENRNIMHFLLESNNSDDILYYILKYYLCDLQYRLICKKLCIIFDKKLLAEKFLVNFWYSTHLQHKNNKLFSASNIFSWISPVYDENTNRYLALKAQKSLDKKKLSFNLLIDNYAMLMNTAAELGFEIRMHYTSLRCKNFTSLSRIESICFGSHNAIKFNDSHKFDDSEKFIINIQKFLNAIYENRELFPNLKKLTFSKITKTATVPLSIPKFETLEVLDFKNFWDIRFDDYPNLKKLNYPIDQQFNNEHYLILDGTLRFRKNTIINLNHDDYWRLEGLIKHLEYSKEDIIEAIIIEEFTNNTASMQNFTILDLLSTIYEKRDLFKKLNKIVLKLKNKDYMNVLQEEFHIVPQFKSSIEVYIEIMKGNKCYTFRMLHKVVNIEFKKWKITWYA